MESVTRRWIVLLIAAFWMLPGWAGASSRILVPGIDFSGEDTKINVPMSLIVDVMLEPGPYTDGPEPRDIMRKYQQDRNGKYDDRILPHLDDKDRRLVELRLQGFSTAEAARQLGEDADVLRVRLSRLRRRLRDNQVLSEWL